MKGETPMELEFDWQERDWHRVFDTLARGSEIPAQRFFALLGSVDEDEALEAALALEARGVGLDVSGLPRWGRGSAAQRLELEYELARKGKLPDGLEPEDPLRLYLQELARQPRLSHEDAHGLMDPNRLTEGLLWLVAEEAPAFAGQGVLLLDLMQEGALGLLGAMEQPGDNLIEDAAWHIRQAMARTVAIAYLASGEAERLLAAMRAYRQATFGASGTEPRAGGAGPGAGENRSRDSDHRQNGLRRRPGSQNSAPAGAAGVGGGFGLFPAPRPGGGASEYPGAYGPAAFDPALRPGGRPSPDHGGGGLCPGADPGGGPDKGTCGHGAASDAVSRYFDCT